MPFPLRRWLAQLLGNRGERLAAKMLKRKGFRILARQCRGRFGEIDLIALDRDTIVFVEVKTRSTERAGLPQEAVDRHKRQCLSRSALAWLKGRRLLEYRCRFDVVAITWQAGHAPHIEHILSAFDAEGPASLYC